MPHDSHVCNVVYCDRYFSSSRLKIKTHSKHHTSTWSARMQTQVCLCIRVWVLLALRGSQKPQLTIEQVSLIERRNKGALEKRAAVNAPAAESALVYF